MSEAWGILRPDDIPSARRLQSLGLTRAIRRFNEKAVPGMGGLWFAMPLIWSMLGISVGRQLERRPIEASNAVEALAMKLALGDDDGEADSRVRGRRNLPRVGRTFDALRKPGAYVTQPFRQTCAQPLVTLGLVEGTSARFNSFRLTDEAERLLGPLAAVHSEVATWARGGKRINWDILSAILPTAQLPDVVRTELTRRIYGDGAAADRRKAIRDAGKLLTSDRILDADPEGLAADHLIDLRGGIATVRLRVAALSLLGAVEKLIAKRREDGLSPAITLAEAGKDITIRKKMGDCADEARRAAPHIEAAGEPESLTFLRECETTDHLLQRLARRDGVVIILRDEDLVPGPAFGAAAALEDDPAPAVLGVPELPRIAYLLALTEDLAGAAK